VGSAQLLNELRRANALTLAPGSYRARGVPWCSGHYVAIAHDGNVAVLIPCQPGEPRRPPIELENLVVRFGATCEVFSGMERHSGLFTSVQCRSHERGLQDYFLSVVDRFVLVDSNAPVRQVIGTLVELFRCLGEPPRKAASGLFGELMLIEAAASTARATEAWHSDVDARYDFAGGPYRIEVKSSASRLRQHEFSAEQCDVPAECVGIVASVFVERVGAGLSLAELLARLEQRLEHVPALVLKLHQQVAATLGTSLQQGLSMAFDEQLARRSICFFHASSIPGLRAPFPTGVSSVRFTADLSGLVPLGGLEIDKLIEFPLARIGA